MTCHLCGHLLEEIFIQDPKVLNIFWSSLTGTVDKFLIQLKEVILIFKNLLFAVP